VRVFKTKWFARFARQERLSDRSLCEAVRRLDRGLVDADLGGGVVKQRVARPGQGRSGGYRVLIAYDRRSQAVFIYGFAKNERANIDPDELATAQDIAKGWLSASTAQLAKAVAEGLLQEIDYDSEQEA
jgi:hypothetical protein